MNNVVSIKTIVRGKPKRCIPALTSVNVQDKVIKIFEWGDIARKKLMNDLINKFTIWVCKYYNIWYSNLSDKKQDEFIGSLIWIWDLFNDMVYDKQYFLNLLDTPISQMSPKQRFNRIFLSFLYRPEDLLNTILLKDSLKRLVKAEPKNKEIKTLEKYFDIILDAIISQLENHELKFDLWYLWDKLVALDDSGEYSDSLI